VISKEHRFHGYNKLQAVYRKGQTARSSFIALKAYKNPRRSSYRLAVVVSRKVNKSAVVRNRIRRRLFENFRKYEHLFGSRDMVVTVFSDLAASCSSTELDEAVCKILEQAQIKPADPSKPSA
jgi:ribonuclease P protein component